MESTDFETFSKLVSEYTLEKVSALTGVEPGFLEELAELYADPDRKVMSLWTMGFNQHVRGVWANQMVYNLHLLTGKISEPRSEEHTSELQSLMRISYAVFCLKKKKHQ